MNFEKAFKSAIEENMDTSHLLRKAIIAAFILLGITVDYFILLNVVWMIAVDLEATRGFPLEFDVLMILSLIMMNVYTMFAISSRMATVVLGLLTITHLIGVVSVIMLINIKRRR